MPISLFESSSTRSVIADWVEVQLLCSGKTAVSSTLVARSESIRGEPVNGREFDDDSEIDFELEITDGPTEGVVDDVWDEIAYRQRVLGELYPFLIKRRGTGWQLTRRERSDELTQLARACYTACLLISAMRVKLLPSAKKTSKFYKKLYKAAPDAFQAISYLVAPAILGGKAYWFGWPRISDTPKYRDALAEVVEQIGHGKLKERDPAWSTRAEKDGTVDIVAWRSFQDRRYGSAILYGQVASGANWRDKAVATYIKGHFFDWFEDTPSAQYLPAMFIPFVLHHDTKPNSDTTFDEAALSAARRDSADFGMILDRLRLTELAFQSGVERWPQDAEIRELGTQIIRWTAKSLIYARSLAIPA